MFLLLLTFFAVSVLVAGQPALVTRAQSFWSISSPGYQYGPTVSLVGENYVAMWCSPGINGAWDAIRMATSSDLVRWSDATIILVPQNGYDTDSTCDPSLVAYRGQWFLYHTCINTKNPPDGYTNNRICVAVADSVNGPYFSASLPVIEDKNCTKNWNAAYCVGQPSAIVHPSGQGVLVYYSKVTPEDTVGPNNGHVHVAFAADGINFRPYVDGPVYPQRDVDVKYDRWSRLFLMVQGDVGSSVLTYSTSADGKSWSPYNPSVRMVATNPNLPAGGTNNNPGLVGLPDGSFDGMTTVVYGSSVTAGWGDWKLYSSSAVLNVSSAQCLQCVKNSCDYGCRDSSGTQMGKCAVPFSTNAQDCCDCIPYVLPQTCSGCVAAGACVAACRDAGYATGVCASPGGRNSSDCCSCIS